MCEKIGNFSHFSKYSLINLIWKSDISKLILNVHLYKERDGRWRKKKTEEHRSVLFILQSCSV